MPHCGAVTAPGNFVCLSSGMKVANSLHRLRHFSIGGSMFRIWAPNADTLRLHTGNDRFNLAKCERGWWSAPVQLKHGQDYSLEINGKAGVPDPRSPWQPRGVHGPSRHVDHSRFEW